MRLLVDNNILIQILAPNKTGLTHPETKAALERVDERAQAFVADEVWSHDDSLRKIASSRGLTVRSLADIEPPAVQSQMFPRYGDS